MKKLFVYYFIFLFSLLSILSSGVIDSIDGFQYLSVARNIYYKGEPIAPPYDYDERKNIHMSVVPGKDGKMYSLTGLGFSLAYVPAVAITDFVYRIYSITPAEYFPLENDWLIFLTAGFTNAFFGAFLGTILLIYFIIFGLSKKQSVSLSLISIFATNLSVYTKHSMAHMMFIAFLMLSFLLIKLYSQSRRKILLILSGSSLGVVMITYNPTFMLAIPPLFLYYLMQTHNDFKKQKIFSTASDILFFVTGSLPFVLIYNWFEGARAVASISNLISIGVTYASNQQPIGLIFEGIYGHLFSPGRSVFIYSPLLLIILFFWHKIRRDIYPEFFAFILYFAILIIFYAKAYTIGSVDQGLEGLWHGESSWGPRYLTPIIPLGMLVVGNMYKILSKKERFFVFIPLVALGFYIGVIGMLIPYQTKYYNLQNKFFLNGSQYTRFIYSNLLPRHSPILTMSKNLINLRQNFPKTFDHGSYNLKFYDGIDFPFNVGPERWRTIEGRGYISFDQNPKDPVRELIFGIINHPVSESSSSARLRFLLNDKTLLEKPVILSINERNSISISVDEALVKQKDNQLEVIVNFDDPEVITKSKQILGLQSIDINGKRQNLESIDVPYVSALGPKMTGVEYKNWGGTNNDPWKAWDIHTQAFERLPDLWWIRNLFYWDIPKAWILLPFTINLFVLIVSVFKLRKALNK